MEDRMRVLIVDDEKVNRDLLADLLDSECDVMLAKGGAQALDAANGHLQPDLILLDVMMPEMDGYEACRRLKEGETTHDIPVIFVTALGDAEAETRGFDMGAVDYIAKPFSPAVVVARVRTHLRLRHQTNLIRRIATLDGLTGIPNRRAFDEGFKREWLRANRAGWPLSLLMIDVDMFKQFNDTYGHGPGDDCLKQVAKALVSEAHRPGDLVARYGGEEFAVVLSDLDNSGAELMGERFRQAVSDLGIPHDASTAADHVTISIGGATCDEPHLLTPEAVMEEADRMLYRAKEAGRNQVVLTRVRPTP